MEIAAFIGGIGWLELLIIGALFLGAVVAIVVVLVVVRANAPKARQFPLPPEPPVLPPAGPPHDTPPAGEPPSKPPE